MPSLTRRSFVSALAAAAQPPLAVPDLPDALLVEAYRAAAERNVLAARNPKVFPGYFSVCADGRGFGYGNTYPSLDGNQMTEALLWLGDAATARENFDYVRRFMRADGALPIAVLPENAGKEIGPKGFTARVDSNGGLYRHWVPGNPLAALAAPTYIQNADAIFRVTLDRDWLAARLPSVRLAADSLASLTREDGEVQGAGYYVERPARINADGVTQPHAADAFARAAQLHAVLGHTEQARRFNDLSQRVREHFASAFWVDDHFAEYRHPERGLIDSHGLSDSNWAALAWGAATPRQARVLWRRLRSEPGFRLGGMPTAIVTRPQSYEAWEFSYPDRMDLAAMGRVWYLEAAARARMGDGEGLVESLLAVARTGAAEGYFWRERYNEKGGYGASKYCEYPANLIRIVNRHLLGIELRVDGTIAISPVAPPGYWKQGFGHTLHLPGRSLQFRCDALTAKLTYSGRGTQRVELRGPSGVSHRTILSSGRPITLNLRAGGATER